MTTFAGDPVTLQGKQLAKGDTLPDFAGMDTDLQRVSLSDTSGVRVFLSVPSVDTGVCSTELGKFIEYVKERPQVTCYSVSMDLPFALSRWCQANSNENVKTLSDYNGQQFGQATGTVVEELNLLTRAVFVVDAQNVLQHVEYVSEITNEPDYQAALAAVDALTA